jgi:predicted enzyme related to lactoylglutathione lyase
MPPQQPEAPPELGDTSWHELYTTDAPAALVFYQALFGWKSTETMDMGPMGKYYMFGRAHGSMGGMMTKTPDMAQIRTSGCCFRVPDVHAAAERVRPTQAGAARAMPLAAADRTMHGSAKCVCAAHKLKQRLSMSDWRL